MDGGDTNSGMPEADIKAMKETLCAQQQLLQNLYAELDVEREASGTAVSEALSMIVRLQDEKSAVMMEASQYKRMSEEKICHAEESLAIFEDILYQKEMEISSLEFQIQAYKYKLLSLGCTELGASDSRFSENQYMQRNDAVTGENGSNVGVRRLKSLPPLQLEDYYPAKSTFGRERSLTPEPEMVSPIFEEKSCQEVIGHVRLSRKNSSKSIVGDFNSYWEQIRKLDEKVKELADHKDAGADKSANLKHESKSSSWISQLSSGTSSDLGRCKIITNLEKAKDSITPLEKEEVVNDSCSPNVYDIFEVPKIIENHKSCEKEEKGKNKRIWEGENRLGKPDPVVEETSKSHIKDDSERVKKVLHSAKIEKRLSKSREGKNVDSKPPLAQPKINHAECQSDIQQLSGRLERLEAERNTTRNEIVAEREEELNLLKEIREQLNSVQREMRSWKTKKYPPRDEPSLLIIQEAMLHFWL